MPPQIKSEGCERKLWVVPKHHSGTNLGYTFQGRVSLKWSKKSKHSIVLDRLYWHFIIRLLREKSKGELY